MFHNQLNANHMKIGAKFAITSLKWTNIAKIWWTTTLNSELTTNRILSIGDEVLLNNIFVQLSRARKMFTNLCVLTRSSNSACCAYSRRSNVYNVVESARYKRMDFTTNFMFRLRCYSMCIGVYWRAQLNVRFSSSQESKTDSSYGYLLVVSFIFISFPDDYFLRTNRKREKENKYNTPDRHWIRATACSWINRPRTLWWMKNPQGSN